MQKIIHFVCYYHRLAVNGFKILKYVVLATELLLFFKIFVVDTLLHMVLYIFIAYNYLILSDSIDFFERSTQIQIRRVEVRSRSREDILQQVQERMNSERAPVYSY